MISFEDKSGHPSAMRDYDEAIEVVKKHLVTGIMNLPSDLAVQLPNILRCLEQGRDMTAIAAHALAKRESK